jgi:hypothetical protein
VTEVADRLDAVRARIASAAARAGRDPAEVTLVAVTKGVEPDAIARAVGAGARDLGENRVQELLAKQEAVRGETIRWHMIGALQRNKAARVGGHVALVHSVDSDLLARAIADAASRAGRVQDVLVEVNTSGEATKHGVEPDRAAPLAAAVASMDGVRLRGFMTMAAAGDPGRARASFRALRAIRDRVARDVPGSNELSMGMSDDFEVAIEEGATIVRVGTAIFGPRAPRVAAGGTGSDG